MQVGNWVTKMEWLSIGDVDRSTLPQVVPRALDKYWEIKTE
jgi:hypothetical protein